MNNVPAVPLAGLNVLIVEDTLINRMILEQWLRRHDVRTCCAETVAAAQQHLQAQAFDAALIDRYLPDGEGFSLLARLPPSVRRIAVTALDSPDDRAAILALGFDAVLSKPVAEAELLAALAPANGGNSPQLADEGTDLQQAPSPLPLQLMAELERYWEQGQLDAMRSASRTLSRDLDTDDTPAARAVHALALVLRANAPDPLHVRVLLDAMTPSP